jgi:hypothetical protein
VGHKYKSQCRNSNSATQYCFPIKTLFSPADILDYFNRNKHGIQHRHSMMKPAEACFLPRRLLCWWGNCIFDTPHAAGNCRTRGESQNSAQVRAVCCITMSMADSLLLQCESYPTTLPSEVNPYSYTYAKQQDGNLCFLLTASVV